MKKFSLLLLPLLILFLSSCEKEEKILLSSIEQILPGEWVIDSMRLDPSVPYYYYSTLIEGDTTLENVGYLSIPTFNVANLDLNSANPQIIQSVMDIDGVELNLAIEKLFLSELEYFAYLRFNDTSANLNTPQGEFAEAVRIFTSNCYVYVIDEDHLHIRRASPASFESIYLSRQ